MRDGSSIRVVSSRNVQLVRWEMDAYTARLLSEILERRAWGLDVGASLQRPDQGWLQDSVALAKAAEEIEERGTDE